MIQYQSVLFILNTNWMHVKNNPIFITLIAGNVVKSFLICFYFYTTVQNESCRAVACWILGSEWVCVSSTNILPKNYYVTFINDISIQERQENLTVFGITSNMIFIFFVLGVYIPAQISHTHWWIASIRLQCRMSRTWSNWNENGHVYHVFPFSKTFAPFALNWKIQVTFILMGNGNDQNEISILHAMHTVFQYLFASKICVNCRRGKLSCQLKHSLHIKLTTVYIFKYHLKKHVEELLCIDLTFTTWTNGIKMSCCTNVTMYPALSGMQALRDVLRLIFMREKWCIGKRTSCTFSAHFL